jgi:hypothetical protein
MPERWPSASISLSKPNFNPRISFTVGLQYIEGSNLGR